jgi:CDP-diglyceride synthetase
VRRCTAVERQSYGDLLLAISVGLCLFLAGDDLHLYVLPIAVLTLADAAAALTGSTYGRTFFRIEAGEKSVEGSAVFFILTLLISIICLMLMTSVPADQHHRHLPDGRGFRHVGGGGKLAWFRQPFPAAGPVDLSLGPRREPA